MVIFTTLATTVHAEIIKWHEGSVVLASEQVVTGQISIEEHNDIVLIRNGEMVNVYPAHKVSAVFFFDAAENTNRKFVSRKETANAFTMYRLYEIVVRGEVSVLRREKYLPGKGKRNNALDFIYLIQLDNQLLSLQEFRSKVFPELLHQSGEVLRVFIKKGRLNINNPSSAIKIIRFCNSQQELLTSASK